MKTFLSLPTNNEFFTRYANLVPTLYKLGFFAQIVSALTESGIIFSIALASLSTLHWFVSGCLAVLAVIVGVGFIEIGLRTFIPYSVRVFIHNLWKGWDCAMSVFILITTIGLVCLSGSLSFNNSVEIADTFTSEVEQADTKGASNNYDKERNEILNNYRTDSSSTASGYIAQINAKNTEYQSLIDIQKRGIERYERQEQREGKSYRTKKILINTEIERLEAVRDTENGILVSSQAIDLKSLLGAKNDDLKEIKTKYRNDVSTIEDDTNKKKDKKENKVQAYGLGLGWFTIICLIVLILSIILDEVHKKGSGIEQKVLPSPYDFSTSIVGEFFSVVSDKIQGKIRTKISEWEKKTPTPPLPTAPTNLYDLSQLEQSILTVKVEERPEETKIVYLPNDNHLYENRREEKNNDSSKKRECEHCQEEYIYNHKKQKYCSTLCRGQAWEQRNGTKLTKRKAK